MKTPEEIKKGLECCSGQNGHTYCGGGCPYSYDDCDDMSADALAYIQQLETQNAALLKDLRDADRIDCEHCASYDDAATKERCGDAEYLCDKCRCADCPCRTCRDCSNWTWRGVRKDAGADMR